MFDADKQRVKEIIDKMKVKDLRRFAMALADEAIDQDTVHVADNGVPYYSQTGESLIEGLKPEWNE